MFSFNQPFHGLADVINPALTPLKLDHPSIFVAKCE